MSKKRSRNSSLATLTLICNVQAFTVTYRVESDFRRDLTDCQLPKHADWQLHSSSFSDPYDDLPFYESSLEDFSFDMDDMIDDPEVLFTEEDLSQLYDIAIPGVSPNSTDPAPIPISLSDLQLISSDLAYFYLRDELGLSEDTMWKITNEAGSVLGLKASTLREKVSVLQTSMSLSDKDVRTMLTSFPTLLHLSANKNLSPKIQFLSEKLELKQAELKEILIGCPSILGYSFSTLSSKLSFFTKTMGFTKKECRDILLEVPRVMTSNTATGLTPRIEFLREEIRIPDSDIRKIVKKNPRILTMSVEQNLQPKIVFYLIMTLYMKPDEVRKLLLSYPQILNYNLESHLQPITRQFLSFDFSAYEFSRMLLRFPRIVTYSLTKMKRVVGYLRFALGLEASDVRRVLHQAPQVVSLTIENLQKKVEYLLQVAEPGAVAGCPSSTQTLRKLIVGMPSLLHLSVETNLKPKVEFLQAELGPEELSKAIDRLPTFLGYSLENRIKPRLTQMLEAGLEGSSITVGIPMKQDKFESWLGRRVEKMLAEKEKEEKEPLASAPLQEVLDTDEKGRIRKNDGRVVHWIRED